MDEGGTDSLVPQEDLRTHLRPSLFDLLAQEQLRDLLHPVFRYVLAYLTQHYPRYLLRVLNHHEEAFAALLLLVERHHLKKHNASLSEHFYQLRLVPRRTENTPLLSIEQAVQEKISRKQRWGLLLFLVGLPYVRARAQDYFERLGGGQAGETEGESQGAAVTVPQRLFKRIYPYANLALDMTLLSYDIAYLFGKTDAYRPWHRWLDLTIERRIPEPEMPYAKRDWLSRLPPLLPPLLLALKLSQWWYSPASPRTLASATATSTAAVHSSILPPRPLPILPSSGLLPPTPPATPPGKKDQPGEMEKNTYTINATEYGTCPLCTKKWQNPAVLPTGWVVCWRCGWDALQDGDDEDEGEGEDETEDEAEDDAEAADKEKASAAGRRKGRCPFTGIEVAPSELRRVLV